MKKDIFLKKLGRHIAKVRKSRGYSQDKLYIECDLARRTIHVIETGRVDPRITTLFKISETLQVPFPDLFKFNKKLSIGFINRPSMKKGVLLQKLGKYVAKVRKKREFSQDRLYLESDLSRRTIYVLETGKADSRITTFLKISETLKISLADLLDFDK